ncbi:hypothetical protein Srufu_003950 [Streptomyces libani subsp. rufus]|nr:hypothetical protein Srufu_003950 [Streptomyces libani subsp. rufus]
MISDSHSGLAAIRTVFLGAAWQTCRVHFVRDVFSVIDKGSGKMVAATIRTIFAQTTAEAVRTQGRGRRHARTAVPPGQDHAAERCWGDHRVRGLPASALEEDLEHQPSGAAEPGDQAAGRRRPGLPRPAALGRLAAAILAELHDEWQFFDRRYLSETSMAELLTAHPTENDRRLPAPEPNQIGQ